MSWPNSELKDDLNDIASMGGARIGLAAQQSDDDLRVAVIRKVAHDIATGTGADNGEAVGAGGGSGCFFGCDVAGAGLAAGDVGGVSV